MSGTTQWVVCTKVDTLKPFYFGGLRDFDFDFDFDFLFFEKDSY